jgi:hypothetical protein
MTVSAGLFEMRAALWGTIADTPAQSSLNGRAGHSGKKGCRFCQHAGVTMSEVPIAECYVGRKQKNPPVRKKRKRRVKETPEEYTAAMEADAEAVAAEQAAEGPRQTGSGSNVVWPTKVIILRGWLVVLNIYIYKSRPCSSACIV